MRGRAVLRAKAFLPNRAAFGRVRHTALVVILTGCVFAAPQAPKTSAATITASTTTGATVAQQPAAETDPAPDPAETDIQGKNPPKSEAQRACESRGGLWARGRSKADCQGQCLARSMTCAPALPMFGCHEVVERSGMRVTLCID
jgi:hypothetical protein